MTQQSRAQESAKSERKEEQEPIVLGDRSGIVVVWPDHYAHRFSWLELRQACQSVEGRQIQGSDQSKEQRGRA